MSITGRILTRFPARVLGGDGISITKSNGIYTFAIVLETLLDLVFDALGLPLAQVTVTTATYTITPTDTVVYVNRAGVVTLALPDAAAWAAVDGHEANTQLIIQDISGAASSNNIAINRVGSDTMNGLTSVSITSDYGGYKLRPAASGLWVIQ